MAAACTILLAATLAVLLAATWYVARMRHTQYNARTEHFAAQDPYKLMSYVRATRTVPMR